MNNITKMYRKREVLELFGISHSTLFREIEFGRFPAPVRVTPMTVAWREDELLEHQQSLTRSTMASPNPKAAG